MKTLSGFFLVAFYWLEASSAMKMDPGCFELDACMRRAEEKYDTCQKMLDGTKQTTGPVRPPADCMDEVRQLIRRKNQALTIKQEQYQECIGYRVSLAAPDEIKRKKKIECQAKIKKAKSRRRRQTTKEENKQRSEKAKLASFRSCIKEQKNMKKQCEGLVQCCSESAVCHLEYETSFVHDEIKQLGKDIILKRRQCKDLQRRRRVDGVQLLDQIDDSDVISPQEIMDADA